MMVVVELEEQEGLALPRVLLMRVFMAEGGSVWKKKEKEEQVRVRKRSMLVFISARAVVELEP